MVGIHWLRSEFEVLRRLVRDRRSLANAIYFALDSAFPSPEHAFAQDVYVAINVPRVKLGLTPNGKPGDVDLLIVPFRGTRVFFERSIGIEVKIVRPSAQNPSKNANTMGRSQVVGLLEDGFPFVGLLHISISEPLPKCFRWKVPHVESVPGERGQLVQSTKTYLFDPFPLYSSARQEGRLLALNLPVWVGYRAIAMSLSEDGSGFSGNTFDTEHRGKENPDASSNLVAAVQALFESEQDLFRRIEWYG